jgi:FMN phosphatase YigB (HAD superfamily)
MMMKDKVILVDCDGVLCDWEFAFENWMEKHGYEIAVPDEYDIAVKYNLPKEDKKRLVRMFNESAWIRKLPPLRDAIKYVKKLHSDHGYIFHCVTSLSDDQYAQHLRTKNLRELFGDTVFDKYVYLDTGADKDEALAKYEGTGCWWIEDKPENANVGTDLGLNSILMNHDHNRFLNVYENTPRVSNWKQIYNIIVGY